MNERPEDTTGGMPTQGRSGVGQVWTPREPMFNTQATRDAIRHFANGIGDRNPLYRDREYARKTRYGCVPAPGCFLHSVYHEGGSSHGGVTGTSESRREDRERGRERRREGRQDGGLGGVEWEWLRPIVEGDEFTFTNRRLPVEERKSSDGRLVVTSSGMGEYKDQHGKVVARAKGWGISVQWMGEGMPPPRQRRVSLVENATYTPEELQKIYDDYDKEVVRGANPRYWEDVQIGDDLGHVVKGPLKLEDIIVWAMGAGSPYFKAHGLKLDYLKRHPTLDIVDRITGEKVNPELWHWVDTVAQTQGVRRALDYGVQRMCWAGHLLTNWVGDDGFVKRMHAQVRAHNFMQDTAWMRGKLTRKYLDENDGPCVDVEIRGENQREEMILSGSATMLLPSREKGTSPLDKWLP